MQNHQNIEINICVDSDGIVEYMDNCRWVTVGINHVMFSGPYHILLMFYKDGLAARVTRVSGIRLPRQGNEK